MAEYELFVGGVLIIYLMGIQNIDMYIVWVSSYLGILQEDCLRLWHVGPDTRRPWHRVLPHSVHARKTGTSAIQHQSAAIYTNPVKTGKKYYSCCKHTINRYIWC